MPILQFHPTDLHCRWMTARDLEDVLKIEQSWSQEELIRCLRTRNCIGMVADRFGHVVGFMIYELRRMQLRLLRFAVHPSFRRRGVGSAMIQALVDKLREREFARIFVEVRETNVGFQLFLRKHGFRAVSLLREFYDAPTEDGYLLHYQPPDSDR